MSSKLTGSSFFRSTRPTETAVTLPDGNLDYAILALGFLVLVGWHPTDASPKVVRLTAAGVAPVALRLSEVRHIRDDVTAQLAKADRQAPYKAGFVAAIRLPSEFAVAIQKNIESGTPITVNFDPDLSGSFRQVHSVEVFTGAAAIRATVLSANLLRLAIESASAEGQTPSDLALELLPNLLSQSRTHAHLDVASTHDKKGAFLVGWIENAADGQLVLVSADLALAPQALASLITPRDDVSAHLRELGETPQTNLHGFVATARIGTKRKSYRLCRMTEGAAAWSSELEIDPRHEPLQVVLGRLRNYAAESLFADAKSYERLARSLVGAESSAEPPVAQIKTFMPAEESTAPIRTSIIVPFYGDAFYLLDHIMAQSRAPQGLEWVFVCDDPRLATGMIETLTNRQSAIRQPTHIVLLAANGGYAHANNIGAKFAKGDYLLLMNSDIYCDAFSFIDAGCEALQKRSDFGCIGFSLQFEDGTIQHDGMTFRRSAFLDGLWACEHESKGMPQDWQTTSVHDVDAVTAALLLLRRRDFTDRNVFDPAYLIGDFEDADLCMRLRANGKAIGLVRTPGLFHLERQSMRHTGAEDARIAITHLNCAMFNTRWSTEIEALAEREPS